MAAILVAEDDDAVREFVTRSLLGDMHDVTAVSDGRQALDALQRCRFDLVLTDIVMPEIDGIAVAAAAADDGPPPRILMMTGYAAERQRAHDQTELAHDVVIKPFTLQQIRDAVSRTLAQDA